MLFLPYIQFRVMLAYRGDLSTGIFFRTQERGRRERRGIAGEDNGRRSIERKTGELRERRADGERWVETGRRRKGICNAA